MPSGIVNQQGLQSLVAHRLTHLGQPFFEYRSFIHSHLANLAAILIESTSLIRLKKVAKLFPLRHVFVGKRARVRGLFAASARFSCDNRRPSPLPCPVGVVEGVKITSLQTIQPHFSCGNWSHLPTFRGLPSCRPVARSSSIISRGRSSAAP